MAAIPALLLAVVPCLARERVQEHLAALGIVECSSSRRQLLPQFSPGLME